MVTMGMRIIFHLQLFLILAFSLSNGEASTNPTLFNRNNFSTDFIFGTASSSYQYEGAFQEGGRGPSIWDTYVHKYPGKIIDGKNGDIAVDSYHRYKEDVKIMKDMRLDAYRFSISWSRILPSGKLKDGINREGIQYYNNLLTELFDKGLIPFVTLFHWDLPQALEDKYGGFLSPKIVKDFQDYANICFREFGDRVKYWITLNEPWSYSYAGYATGNLAPGRCSSSSSMYINCTGGDSSTEPYLVTHHQLLAHAAAVKLYRDKYQAHQKGNIGITLVAQWTVPYSESRQDQNAALRYIDFMVGWFMDPLTRGIYPRTMRFLVGKRLPKFSKEQSKMLKGSFDFIGLNYYTANYARNVGNHKHKVHRSIISDPLVNLLTNRNGKLIGPQAASSWLFVYPRGIRDILLYVKNKYNNPLIYITENGVDEVNNGTISLEEALVDNMRIDYFYQHLSFLKQAIEDGVNVKGYFAWSLLDNFEWSSGYTVRFGIYYVDYKDGLKRHPKRSAEWFKNFLGGKKKI